MQLILSPPQQNAFVHLDFAQKSKPITGTFPDFMILGPQRTGTTWLSHNLRLHPEIFISQPKELYFFNRLLRSPKYSPHFEKLKRNLGGNNYRSLKSWGRELGKILYFDLLKTGRFKANQLEWYLKFFNPNALTARKEGKAIQEKTGVPYQPKVFGEATATYAAMSEEIVREVCLLNPDLKIILMIREPVERAWSHAKKDLVRNQKRAETDIDEAEFKEYFSRKYQLRCSKYSTQIETWSKYLPQENIFLGQYQFLTTRPKEFVMDVFEFLGVEMDERFVRKSVADIVNPTAKSQIPEKFRTYLRNLFSEEYETLKREFDISFPS